MRSIAQAFCQKKKKIPLVKSNSSWIDGSDDFEVAVPLELHDAKYGIGSIANGPKEVNVMIIVMWMGMV